MSKKTSEQLERDLAQIEKTSGGGHLGGTEFGQVAGEAKVKHPENRQNMPRPETK